MQLDLFLDSRAVMLANDARLALTARDAGRARAALRELRVEAPDYPGLDALEALAAALADWSLPPGDAAAIARAADWLDRDVVPAALRVLGDGAAPLVAGCFHELAEAARALPYDPARPRAHRAWLCLRCGEWAEAEAAADSIPAPRTNRDALHWRCVARYRRLGLDAARGDLFALAWRAPARFTSVREELGDELLARDWARFEGASPWESLDESALPAWFPAWCVVEHPALAASLKDVELPDLPAAEAARLLADLFELERRGDQRRLVAKRARLRELNPDFFALYMANRATRYL